jgi:hypothetical protein
MPRTYLNPNGSGSSGVLPPLEVVATWPKPNYDDPVTRPKAVLATACVLGTIMVAIVGARLWARFFIQRNGGLDDWVILVAMVRIATPFILLPPSLYQNVLVTDMSMCNLDSNNSLHNSRVSRYAKPFSHCRVKQKNTSSPSTHFLTNNTATERYGFDRHMWDVLPTLYVPERQAVFGVYSLYVVATGLIKISILLFYRRLDARCIPSAFRIITWISIAVIALFISAFTIVLFTACDPFPAFWNQFDVALQLQGYKYHCWINEEADIMAASIISAIQDGVAAFLPTLLYWNLQIPQRQKIALGAVFALGYLVCIACAMRVYAIYRIFHNPKYDATWTTWPALLLALIEIQLGAIVASAPALKVFAKHFFGASAWGSSAARYAYGSSGATDGSVRQGEFRRPIETETDKSASTMSRSRVVDEEGGLALLEMRKSGTNYNVV